MDENLKKQNVIVSKSFELAVATFEFCDELDRMKKWSLSDQILRSALSIGANVKEAQNAESKNDFIHKMKIAVKEAEELEYYFEVCIAVKKLPSPVNLLEQVQAICRILNKIIASSKTSK